jgi:ribosome biogenesis GTPase
MARRRLTEQQKARIAKIQEQRRRRSTALAEARTQTLAPDEALRQGQVVARHGRNLVVVDAAGTLHHCLFRANVGDVVCGDRVAWQPTSAGEGVVTALLERRSVLSRPDYSGRDKPLAANITQMVIVLAPRPEPSGFLLDQYLVAAELIGVRALIALNKSDLLADTTLGGFRQRFQVYEHIGYRLITVSAKREHGLDPLTECLRGETSILVGQSGVGKSSLINALVPDQATQVGRLSETTGLGRHTTSATTLYTLPTGGQLIDSPGVRSFRIAKVDRQQLEQGFREFRPYLGRCAFRNCAHDNEPGCALREAVAAGRIDPRRLETLLRLVRSLTTTPR